MRTLDSAGVGVAEKRGEGWQQGLAMGQEQGMRWWCETGASWSTETRVRCEGMHGVDVRDVGCAVLGGCRCGSLSCLGNRVYEKEILMQYYQREG